MAISNCSHLEPEHAAKGSGALRDEPLFRRGPFERALRLIALSADGNPLLSAALPQALRRYAETRSSERAFVQLLPDVLSFSGSRFGFLAEVCYSSSGAPYFLSHAVVDVYKPGYGPENIVSGLQFHNIATLNGAVMTSAEPVLTNDPARDPRRGGLPPDHARLDSYLGLPFITPDDADSGAGDASRNAQSPQTGLVGGLALANRDGGYGERDIHALQTLCDVAALMISGHRGISPAMH